MMDPLQERTTKEVSKARPSPLNETTELDSHLATTEDYFESLLAAAARASAAARSAQQLPKSDLTTDRPRSDRVQEDPS
ncbi:MAG TPA: hypothetical protein VJW93_15425 [Candidatus Acidoferrales bacterium]|nr:hypothetical protein [Candidatus Acidoferrales bacterium]